MSDADRAQKNDMEFLLQRPEFLRFLWRVIQKARIFEAVTDGSDTRHLYHEGRRDLGLELLADAEMGQPVPHPDGLPVLTAIQVLREEANKPPSSETKNGRRSRSDRYDRSDDLDRGDGDGRDGD